MLAVNGSYDASTANTAHDLHASIAQHSSDALGSPEFFIGCFRVRVKVAPPGAHVLVKLTATLDRWGHWRGSFE